MARVGGGQTPQVMRQFLIYAGKALLILPVPWAFSQALSATACPANRARWAGR